MELPGILGRPVQLLVNDSKGEIPLVVAAYKKLAITEQCALIIVEGTEPVFSCMEAGAELYKEFPHIMFGVFVSHDDPTHMVGANYDKYKFFFRPFSKGGAHYDPELKIWELWTKVIGTKKLAFLAEDMAFAKPLMEGLPGKFPSLPQLFRSKGIEVVYTGQNSIREKMFLLDFQDVRQDFTLHESLHGFHIHFLFVIQIEIHSVSPQNVHRSPGVIEHGSGRGMPVYH